MPEWITIGLLPFTLGAITGYLAYSLGVSRERMRHFEWLSDGWDMCLDHVNWLRLTASPEKDWAHEHLMYMTDVFGAGRPYPVKKEKVSKEK